MARKPALLFKGSFHDGIVRDTARHAAPAAAVYNAVDELIHRPGVAEKRGGWERHSAALGGSTSVTAVATIHIPTRVVAVGSNGTLYDVTSESVAQATSVGTCPSPGENPPLYVDFLVFCYSDASAAPKKVYTTGGGGTVTLANLGGSPPAAAHSAVYASRIVLGRSTTAAGNLNRIWFSDLPDVESSWLWAGGDYSFIDTTYEVVGLVECSGVLLIFSPTNIERIVGGVPPGMVNENMELQPVAGVGCLDARSIVKWDNDVIFAGQEGVWKTNGSGIESFTKNTIQSYWRSLFTSGNLRQLIAGRVDREFYKIDALDTNNASMAELLLHVPTGTWTRLSNTACRMYARGRDESEIIEIYGAACDEGYVNRYETILAPTWARKADGDTTTVAGVLEFTVGDAGPLKKLGGARITYGMTVGVTTAWAADTVKTVGSQIYENNQVFEVTARAGDFKTGLTEPTWSTPSAVGDTIVDDMVTWTNRGPQLIVETAPTLDPVTADFTTRARLTVPSTSTRRAKFDCFYDEGDNAQAVTVRITQSGASLATTIYSVELLVDDVLEGQVTGGA